MVEHLEEAQRLVRIHGVPEIVAADAVQEYVLLAVEEVEGDIFRLAVNRAWKVFEQQTGRIAPWPAKVVNSHVSFPVEFEHSATEERRTFEERERAWSASDRVTAVVETLPEEHRRAIVEHYGLNGTMPLSGPARAETHGTTEGHERAMLKHGRALIERRIETGGLVPERIEEDHPAELYAAVAQLSPDHRKLAECRLAGMGPTETARHVGWSISKVERTLRRIQQQVPLPPPRRTQQ